MYQQHKVYSRLKNYQKVVYEKLTNLEKEQEQQETLTFEEIK